MSQLGGIGGIGGLGGIGGIGGSGGRRGIGGISSLIDPANPLLANAKNRSRGALVGPFQALAAAPVLSPVDNVAALKKWDPTPRLQTCMIDLLSGLHVAPDAGNPTQMNLGFVDLSALAAPMPLAKLVRPTAAIFQKQLSLVANYAELREDRGAEVLTQIPNQNEFWGPVIGLNAHRHRRTLELMALAMTLANAVEMRLKHAFACLRPDELSPQIQPMIPTPGHGAWPSGHATEIYMTATVLGALVPAPVINTETRVQLDRLAARVAVNRTVAGVHYPVDSAAGRLLGTALGEFFAARCGVVGDVLCRTFNGTAFHGAQGAVQDFDPRVSLNGGAPYYAQAAQGTAVVVSPLLQFLWKEAAGEWQV